MSNEQVNTDGVEVFVILIIISTALKLTGYVAWSWWWVLAPLWMPILLGTVLFLIVECIKFLFVGVHK